MNNLRKKQSGQLTILEQFVAVAWLPASQLGGYSNRAQYLALCLIVFSIFYRTVLLPLGSPTEYAARSRRMRGHGNSLLIAWLLFGVFQIIFQIRGFGTFWGLKEIFLSLSWLSLIPIYYYVSFASLTPPQAGRMISLTTAGLFIIIFINLVGYLAQFQTESSLDGYVGGNSKMLELIGVTSKRVIFPFGGGVNSYGVIVALALVSSFTLLFRTRNFIKFVSLFIMAACLYTLAAADSRAALGVALFLILIYLLFPNIFGARSIALVIFVPLLGPALLILLPHLVPDWFVQFIARSGSTGGIDEVLTTGRAVFWKAVFFDLINHPVELLLGYGPYSQAISSAGVELGRHLGATGGVGQFTFHSTAAQTVMDLGIGGVIALYTFVFHILRASSNIIHSKLTEKYNQEIQTYMMLAMLLLVLILCGVTESVLTYYLRDSFILLVALSSIITASYLLYPKRTVNLSTDGRSVNV